MAVVPVNEEVDALEKRLPRPVGLADLYKSGKQITVGPAGATMDVWVQKLTGLEHEECVRKASAAKAVVTTSRSDTSSDEWMGAVGQLLDALSTMYSDDEEDQRRELAMWAKSEEIAQVAVEIEARLMGDSEDEDNEWAKDGYVNGLVEAWLRGGDDDGAGGLNEEYVRCPDPGPEDSPRAHEAKRVFNEIGRFLKYADEQINEQTEAIISNAVATMTVDELRDQAAEKFLDARAAQVWHQEFIRWRAYHSTRDVNDHSRRLFESRAAVDDCDEMLIGELASAYDAFALTSAEGKDSRPDLSSLEWSGPIEAVRSTFSGLPTTGP